MMIDPGWLYLLAASLPIAIGLLLLILPERARRWTAWIVAGSFALSVGISTFGLVQFQYESQAAKDQLQAMQPWSASLPWLDLTRLSFGEHGQYQADTPSVVLSVGYHVDSLTTVLFAFISVVAFCVALHFLSATRHRFLAAFSVLIGVLLHLLLADNLFQIFVCWELLSLCCFWLQEQPVALKSFIMGRVGDAALLIGIAILWTTTGTLSLVTVREDVADVLGNVVMEDGQPKRRIEKLSLTDALRTPSKDTHDELFAEKDAEAGQICRVNLTRTAAGRKKLELATTGSLVVVWNQETLNSHFHKPDRRRFDAFDPHSKSAHGKGLRTIPYWMLTLAGLCLFLGIVCKSTPAGSLPMIIAGIYLLARVFPLLTPEVLLFIAYTGVIIAFYAATCAVVQRDVNRLLAYVTTSQLGLMLAGLGVGAWPIALLQLLAVTCCMTLLSLCISSAGRWRSLILFGCLSMAGLPLLPGWYGQTGILAALISYSAFNVYHLMLVALPLISLVLLAASLVRVWWLIDSPASQPQGIPPGGLLILALFSLALVWLPQPFAMEKTWLIQLLNQSEPVSVRQDSHLAGSAEQLASGYFKTESWVRPVFEIVPLGPLGLAIVLSLLGLILGGILVWRQPRLRILTPDQPSCPRQRFFESGWHMDKVLHLCFITPVLLAGRFLYVVDRQLWDGLMKLIALTAQGITRLIKGFDDLLVNGVPLRWKTRSIRLDLILPALVIVAIGAIVLAWSVK